MPQVPSPNMGIIWPSDHDDANQWDVIMDTAVRVVIDGHNHAAGNGAKISISQLAFDADISFVDSGGGKHAITDLKAIDFFPVDVSAVTALAGALFLNSADNELYYRTTAGANVKFTNGATLNVGAFTGGFGGDYAGVGALAIFDDATDAYWFNQQVGASVRQYAKVRHADLSLFEFKAVGATPVPVQAVTLKSPAALVAGYALTLPGALPAIPSVLQSDAAGNLSYNNPTNTPRNFSVALGVPAAGINFQAGGSTAGNVATQWQMGTSTAPSVLPIVLPVGLTIASWLLNLSKGSASGTITAILWDSNHATGLASQIGATQTNGAASPGPITLGQSGLSTPVVTGHSYWIELKGSGVATDLVFGYTVTPA